MALFDRVLEADEVREDHLRYRALAAARPPVPELVVEAELVAMSRAPSLAEIAPYRTALAVAEYELRSVISGPPSGGILRVAEWVLLDGEEIERPPVGSTRRLRLEPHARNPQLESVYLADTLPDQADRTLYFAVGN